MTEKAGKLTTMSSLPQVARRLNISLGTARKLVDDGHLTRIRLGTRTVRISDLELENFIASQGSSANQGASK